MYIKCNLKIEISPEGFRSYSPDLPVYAQMIKYYENYCKVYLENEDEEILNYNGVVEISKEEFED